MAGQIRLIPDLFEGILRGNFEQVQSALKAGASPNALNEKGVTALILSVISGSKQIVELLMAYGAVVTARDRNGRTPAYYAAQHGHTEILEMLRIAERREQPQLCAPSVFAGPAADMCRAAANNNVQHVLNGQRQRLNSRQTVPDCCYYNT